MKFVVSMTFRELRASWRRLAFFFLCVAVGVGGIAALRSLIQNVRVALTAEARTLTGADVYLRADRPWTDEVLEIVARRLEGLPGSATTETVDTTTMARRVEESSTLTQVVELRAVQEGFPFYGRVVLRSGRPYSFDVLADHGAVVGPELLTQLDLNVGDQMAIGQVAFTIRDVVESEAGRQLGAFSFGPRVMVGYDDADETGVLTATSRASRQVLVRLAEEREIDPLVEDLRSELEGAFVQVSSYRRTENRIERNLGRTENYLSLIGFVVVILGGIGVWSVTRVFVQQRLKSAAILRCLGATTGRVLAVYVLQVLLLGAGGSVLGILLARLALAMVPEELTAQAVAATGIAELSTSLTASAVVQGIVVGVLVALLFALVPLLDIRHAKPLLLLRQGAGDATRGFDWIRVAVTVAVCGALVVVAGWQASSLEVGLYVIGGFAVIAVTLYLIGRGLVLAIRPLQAVRWFPLRHAALSLSRPGNQTRVILLAVGLGSFFIIGVQVLQANLIRNFSLELRDDTPDMFLIDIQEDQRSGVGAVIERHVGLGFDPIPVLRARVIAVEGERVRFDDPRGTRRAGLGREYTVTYRAQLEANEGVVAGTFWSPTESAIPEVSIEEGLHRERGIQVGDMITFDVLGRPMIARVSSVRTVEWDDSRSGGFMFVFRPGSFGGAPHSYIAFLKGPSEPAARAALQRDVVAQHANVSVIDGMAVIRTLRRVLSYVTMAINVVGSIAFLSGGLILVGSVAMTKYQRLYESAILKTLGADTRLLATMLVLEYGVLGALAGTVGSLGAMGLSWVLTRQVFEITWFPAPMTNALGVLVTALVVSVVGVVSSIDVIRRKPLATLRAE